MSQSRKIARLESRAVIAVGLAIIISSGFGYKVSFEHVFPTFIKK